MFVNKIKWKARRFNTWNIVHKIVILKRYVYIHSSQLRHHTENIQRNSQSNRRLIKSLHWKREIDVLFQWTFCVRWASIQTCLWQRCLSHILFIHNLFVDIYKTKACDPQTKWHMFRTIQLFISDYEFQMWKMNQTYQATLCFTVPCYACQFVTNSWINRLTQCAPIDSSHSSTTVFLAMILYIYA